MFHSNEILQEKKKTGQRTTEKQQQSTLILHKGGICVLAFMHSGRRWKKNCMLAKPNWCYQPKKQNKLINYKPGNMVKLSLQNADKSWCKIK